MGQPGDSEQGDDRTVVRQGVHAAAGHGSDPVQHLQGNAGCVGGGNETVGHSRQGDAHAAGSRAGNAGQQGHGNGFVDQRVGDALQCVGQHQKAWQGGDHGTETIFGGRIHRRQHGTADSGAATVGQLAVNGPETECQYHEDAHQQRCFHCPDGRQLGDFRLHWRGHARQAEGMDLAIPLRDPVGETQVHDAHQQQW
ncbi:hypothetical protein D9M71_133940 [compost metagenome]